MNTLALLRAVAELEFRQMQPLTREQFESNKDPWEILVIAALFFFPGLFMLLHHGPMIGIQQSFRYVPSSVTAISEHGVAVFGALAVGVAVLLLLLYFYLRRVLRRASPHIVEHGRTRI